MNSKTGSDHAEKVGGRVDAGERARKVENATGELVGVTLGTSTAGTASVTACRNAASSTVVRAGAAGRLTAERTSAAKFEGVFQIPDLDAHQPSAVDRGRILAAGQSIARRDGPDQRAADRLAAALGVVDPLVE